MLWVMFAIMTLSSVQRPRSRMFMAFTIIRKPNHISKNINKHRFFCAYVYKLERLKNCCRSAFGLV